MSELERLLGEATPAVDWPPTPRLSVPAAEPERWRRTAVVVVLAVLLAIAAAFAVPGARSAILRALHLEGVMIQRVAVLPPAEELPLSSGLGPVVTRAEAERALAGPVALPRLSGTPVLRLESGVVSTILDPGEPVLLSQFHFGGDGSAILQKLVGESTGVRPVKVGGSDGFWISGAEHVYLAPSAPPRLAGNTLLWESGGTVYRLEGRGLTRVQALRLAAEIRGT